jgi:RNA-directed DNA polymerase
LLLEVEAALKSGNTRGAIVALEKFELVAADIGGENRGLVQLAHGHLRTGSFYQKAVGSIIKLSVTPLKAHVKRPVVITLDIQGFFPSVQSKTVCRAFEDNGFPEDVASLLARLTTHKGKLPQGAPTSPAIARIVLCDACKEFEKLLNSVSPYAKATIYVDDITISGPIGLERLIPTVISIFKRHGYSVNPSKIKKMTQSEEQIVLGLRVNRRVEPSSEFQTTFKLEQQKRHPQDPKMKGLEAYKNYITRGD